MQFRVITVTDTQTNNARLPVANTQTGLITIHCAAKLIYSAQCKNTILTHKWMRHEYNILHRHTSVCTLHLSYYACKW